MRNYGYSEDGSQPAITDFAIWRQIAHFSSARWLSITIAVLLAVLVTGGTLLLPHLVRIGIDTYIADSGKNLATRLTGLSHIAMVYGGVIFMVFFASFAQTLILEWAGQSIMHSVRQRLFIHLLGLDLSFFNNNPTGKLVTRLTNDVQNMNEMFTSVIVTIFNDFLRLGGIVLLLFWMNFRLAALLVCFIPIAITITILFARLARVRFRAIRTQLARINSFLAENLAGISIVQLFGRQQATRKTFETLTQGYLNKTLSQIRLFGTFMPLTEFMSSAAIAIILWYGGGEILKERLTIGELVAFISYMRLFFQPLRELAQKYSIVQSAMASAERIFMLLDEKGEETIENTGITPEGAGEIIFDKIRFSYEPETPILRDVSFTIRPGSTVALVGSTGSGKSTVVKLLLNFYTPQQGNIYLDGIPLQQIRLNELRTRIGTILQDVYILQDTLLANIVLDTGTSRHEVEKILDSTGMRRFVDRLPQGLDTMIGEGGQELSTGEKQILSFARVLCRKPSILILDEATAAIDTESENILERAIEESFQDRTSLVIAHRLSTIRRATHIIVMDKGKIVEHGSHETLLKNRGRYARMVAMDMEDGSADDT